jgi:uncharacterized protein YndB with AHSA1/START domain
MTAIDTTTAIRHRVGIDAPLEQVHHALTTTDGLAAWWTQDTSGDPTPGGVLTFRFGEKGAIVFEVVEVTPDRIAWRGLLGGPDEWVDTTVTFELEQDGDETVIRFTHAGWRDDGWFQGHCSTKWGSYLLGMKDLLEGRDAHPFPNDLPVSRWD